MIWFWLVTLALQGVLAYLMITRDRALYNNDQKLLGYMDTLFKYSHEHDQETEDEGIVW